ncbi:hypothetical protein [Jannaschia formosa]|uniref:hypothetical protein n=1 Tax=Jannaschia formosa TaxID=2259592 RepID=UPI000E1C2D35|nr:hypothetical protein [Jannaschia formosa]TFL16701.1 hypothetical protein DR046_18685 [Jannaschia formosa]
MYRLLALPVLALTLSACVTQQDVGRGAVGAGLGCVAGEIIRDGQCVEGAVLGGTSAVVGGRIR